MYHLLNVRQAIERPFGTGKDGLRLNPTHMTQLMEEEELLQIVRIKSRRLKDYRDRKIIPFIKTGRSVLYDPEAVVLALKKLEREPVGILGKREKREKAKEVAQQAITE
jgi:hypothetical protein